MRGIQRLTRDQAAAAVGQNPRAIRLLEGLAEDVAELQTATNGVPLQLADGPIITADGGLANVFKITLGGNRALAMPANLRDGQTLMFLIRQDGAGSRALTFDPKFLFPGGVSALSAAPNALDVLRCHYDAAGDVLLCGLTLAYA